MRDISTITVREGRELWDSVMPEKFKPFNGVAHKFEANEKAPERVVFMQGLERLGIYFNGHVWADSDLIPLRLDQKKISKYLETKNISIK